MSDLRKAAQALLARWDSPQWEWAKHGPTADLIADLRAALAQPEAQPVARVAEVHMSRYTVEWTNGPLPEGTLLYAQQPTLAKPDQPTADGPTREDGQTAPSATTSDRGLPEPDVTALSRFVLRDGSVHDLAYSHDAMLAFRAEGVKEERERCARVCEHEICACCWDDDAQAAAEHLADAIRKG